ncbi:MULTISPECIES: YgaP family membrane protein [Dyadobacter]|uniref:DUF2892 domain-containing protein n=1 Tax=Dyadobacter sediminis TaxID=1493691 RepID=A0A5R9K359_9BACT|nr:DUF2892 domain-containing protein [Dyadobacter sediminis]TLU88710.1 DUF2892 domain-containing protein [Dyadobacter sediminis]GGC14081.1 hypothetical protein GCM10011325_46260 [Dyadobacter sediminis]
MGIVGSFVQKKLYSKIFSKDGIINVGNAERIGSFVAGSLITYYGIKNQNTLIGKAASLVGGLLIARGASGYCPINKTIGRDTHKLLIY